MPGRLPISVAMIAHNEAHNLPRSLGPIADWVREIVVVINDCSDHTRDVAEAYGARVLEHEWLGHRDQKNVALHHVHQPWVLALDADEEVSAELERSLRAFLHADPPEFAGAMFPRKVWFLGHWIRHGDWYPDWSLRLFRNGRGRWTGASEHDKLELDGRCARLRGDLYHYSFPTLHFQMEKMMRNSDAFLERRLAAGAHWSATQAFSRALWRVARHYVFRLGFLDGFPGLYIAWLQGFSTFYRYTRLYEHQMSQRSPAPVTKRL